MKDVVYYDIIGNSQEINGKDIPVNELINNKVIFKKGIERYQGLHSLNKGTSHDLMIALFGGIGVELDMQFLKDLGPISFQVRQNIKNTDRSLLEILDSPDFLMAYVYLLSGFSIGKNSIESKNSVNTISNLASVIKRILSRSYIESTTFFCAHRENSEINKDSLVRDINTTDFYRVQNLIDGILSNTPTVNDYKINFYGIGGDAEGITSVFPNIFLNYFKKGELYKMVDILDGQFTQLKDNLGKNSYLYHSTTAVSDANQFLNNRYGCDWGKISSAHINDLSNYDNIAHLAIKYTLPDLKRFEEAFNKFISEYPKDKIHDLILLNIKNAKESGNQEIIGKAIDMFFNKSNLPGKSLYETTFYYLWGEKTKENNGIALGFDRDHDLYQTESFSLGSKLSNDVPPLLYGKRTGKKTGNKIHDISFRQFWHYYE